jgi:hypothetical protein
LCMTQDGDPGGVMHLPHDLSLPSYLRQGSLDGKVNDATHHGRKISKNSLLGRRHIQDIPSNFHLSQGSPVGKVNLAPQKRMVSKKWKQGGHHTLTSLP